MIAVDDVVIDVTDDERIPGLVSTTARAKPAVQASAVVTRSRAGNAGGWCAGAKTGATEETGKDDGSATSGAEVEGGDVEVEMVGLLKGSAGDDGDGGVGAGGGGDGGLMHVHRRVDMCW